MFPARSMTLDLSPCSSGFMPPPPRRSYTSSMRPHALSPSQSFPQRCATGSMRNAPLTAAALTSLESILTKIPLPNPIRINTYENRGVGVHFVISHRSSKFFFSLLLASPLFAALALFSYLAVFILIFASLPRYLITSFLFSSKQSSLPLSLVRNPLQLRKLLPQRLRYFHLRLFQHRN